MNVEEPEAIVRALAAQDPIASEEMSGDYCTLCDGDISEARIISRDPLVWAEPERDLTEHDEDCPWRMAREFMAGP